jgi:hypothetical protein
MIPFKAQLDQRVASPSPILTGRLRTEAGQKGRDYFDQSGDQLSNVKSETRDFHSPTLALVVTIKQSGDAMVVGGWRGQSASAGLKLWGTYDGAWCLQQWSASGRRRPVQSGW